MLPLGALWPQLKLTRLSVRVILSLVRLALSKYCPRKPVPVGDDIAPSGADIMRAALSLRLVSCCTGGIISAGIRVGIAVAIGICVGTAVSISSRTGSGAAGAS